MTVSVFAVEVLRVRVLHVSSYLLMDFLDRLLDDSLFVSQS